MYEIDPEPNSDQTYCHNCEMIVDTLDLRNTSEGDPGCTECISNCAWCGNSYFNDEMFDCPFFGRTCQSCLNGEEYQKALRQEVLKNALRCYFDQTTHKQIEKSIISITMNEGFQKEAREMKSDIKQFEY